MAATDEKSVYASEVIRLARDILQDTRVNEYRYTEASLRDIYNLGIREVRRVRPDFFMLASDGPLPVLTDVSDLDTTLVNIPDWSINSLVMFIAGYAELRDDQFTVDARAATLLSQFTVQLVGDKRNASSR